MNIRKDLYKHQGQRTQLAKLLEANKISDKNVLWAIANIPRHLFLSKDFEDRAYDDVALPIDEDQTISQPYTVAFQTQALQINSGDKVLEIGTGSGYQAAILNHMGAEVYSVERIEKLHRQAKLILNQYGKNVKLFLSDGTMGLAEHAPFDKIIVTAAAPKEPETLIAQLKPGGMAIIPIGNLNIQKMVLIKKSVENIITQKELGDFRFVPLIGKDGWQKK
ncbi:MAG: protein-L-isoaspartate(D-aspartate) O-methyltransferase [Bacteroidia bacterium]